MEKILRQFHQVKSITHFRVHYIKEVVVVEVCAVLCRCAGCTACHVHELVSFLCLLQLEIDLHDHSMSLRDANVIARWVARCVCLWRVGQFVSQLCLWPMQGNPAGGGNR